MLMCMDLCRISVNFWGKIKTGCRKPHTSEAIKSLRQHVKLFPRQTSSLWCECIFCLCLATVFAMFLLILHLNLDLGVRRICPVSVSGPITCRIIRGTNAAFTSHMRPKAGIMRSSGASKQSSVTEQNLKVSQNHLWVSTLYRAAVAALCTLSVYPTPA